MSRIRRPRHEVTEFEEIFRGFRFEWIQLKRGGLRLWWSLQWGLLSPLWPPNWFRWIWRSDVCRFITLPLRRVGLRVSPFREFGTGEAGFGESETAWKAIHFQPVEREKFTSITLESLKEALREPTFEPTVVERTLSSTVPEPQRPRRIPSRLPQSVPAKPRPTEPRPAVVERSEIAPPVRRPAERHPPRPARRTSSATTSVTPAQPAPLAPRSTGTYRATSESRGPAWTFASITGTVGVILLFLLLFGSLQTPQPAGTDTETAGLITPRIASARIEQPIEPLPPVPPQPEFPPQPEPQAETEPQPQVQSEFFPQQPAEPDPFREPEPISPVEYRQPAPVISPPDYSLSIQSVPTDPKYFRPVPDDPEEYFLHAGSETAQFDPAAASERFDPLAELTARSDNWMRSIADRPAEPAIDRLYRDQVPAEELAQLLAAATAPVPLPDTASSSRDMELEITRTTPESAGNGQPLVYSIQLENRGSDPIDDVTVQEQLPAGARLASTTPHTAVEQDHLLWRIRQLKPGGKTSLRVELQPETTGTLSGSATVRTTAAVGSTTTVESGLELSLEVLSPERVRVGEECPLNVKVTNSGSATAEGVAIHADLPAELGYHKGRTLIYQIGSLPAGETHTAHLTAVGSASGTGRSLLKVVTSSDSQAPMERETTVDVYPAAMRISRIGPETLHRGSTAHFENRLENLTEEPLTDVTLVEVVPEGVEVLSVGDGGKYDRGTGTITWQIDRIPAGSPVVRTVDLKYNREGRSLSDLTAQTASRSLDDRRFIADVAPPAAPRAERQTDREPARRAQQERPASRARGFLPCQPRPLVCR